MIQNRVKSIEDDFLKGKMLGEGSFGKVYLCFKKGDPEATPYALKELSKTEYKNRYAEHFLKNEMVIMRQISHANCVKLIDIFQNEEKYFIVEELMLGDSLEKILDKSPQLFTPPVVAKLIIQLLKGLVFLHGINIVHRDIKIENILLDKKLDKYETDPIVKIADFGLACYLDPTSKGLNCFCGTDPYMAPEILKMWQNPSSLPSVYKSRLQRYNQKVDVWALGVVTFELLSGGHSPFQADD